MTSGKYKKTIVVYSGLLFMVFLLGWYYGNKYEKNWKNER